MVDAAVQRHLRGAALEPIDVDLLQHRDRIVIALLPQHRIQIAEQADAFVVPAPPEVLRERSEPLVHRRDELSDRARFADDRRQLRRRRP